LAGFTYVGAGAGFDTVDAGAGFENVVELFREPPEKEELPELRLLLEEKEDRLGLEERLKLELPRANRSALAARRRTTERARAEKRLIDTPI